MIDYLWIPNKLGLGDDSYFISGINISSNIDKVNEFIEFHKSFSKFGKKVKQEGNYEVFRFRKNIMVTLYSGDKDSIGRSIPIIILLKNFDPNLRNSVVIQVRNILEECNIIFQPSDLNKVFTVIEEHIKRIRNTNKVIVVVILLVVMFITAIILI